MKRQRDWSSILCLLFNRSRTLPSSDMCPWCDLFAVSMGANIAAFSQTQRSSISFARRKRQTKGGTMMMMSVQWPWETFSPICPTCQSLTLICLDTRLDSILSKNIQHRRSLDEIMKCTRFSKAEIRLLYRSFKQVTIIVEIWIYCTSLNASPFQGMSWWKCQWRTFAWNLSSILSSRQ